MLQQPTVCGRKAHLRLRAHPAGAAQRHIRDVIQRAVPRLKVAALKYTQLSLRQVLTPAVGLGGVDAGRHAYRGRAVVRRNGEPQAEQPGSRIRDKTLAFQRKTLAVWRTPLDDARKLPARKAKFTAVAQDLATQQSKNVAVKLNLHTHQIRQIDQLRGFALACPVVKPGEKHTARLGGIGLFMGGAYTQRAVAGGHQRGVFIVVMRIEARLDQRG